MADEKKQVLQETVEHMESMLSNNQKFEAKSSWDCVLLSRQSGRPGAKAFISMICDQFMELHGDRSYGDDPAMIGGIGTVEGRAITFIGNRKGANFRENVSCNYGMSNPEGYRKALRLAKQAEKFGRPVVCFIDTPGAYPGLGSEERGIGEAIAQNLKVFSTLKTPVLCFIIGEGGSGGALGIGIGDKLYMLENAVYSVITPEGFASILLRDPSKAKEAAEAMKMTSRHLKEFGVIHDIIEEKSPKETAQLIKETIIRDLDNLCSKPPEHLVRYRLKKIRGIGEVRGGKEWWQPLLEVFAKTQSFR
ncbi:MAG: Acetyl-coenzyme carboxylase carboxyl transferase subunit alpha [Spirochaeta sp.]|nr:Acetyl-coenzyme carboxylase carboxyl transferase subunit alpha [Spirochaeta sp.]